MGGGCAGVNVVTTIAKSPTSMRGYHFDNKCIDISEGQNSSKGQQCLQNSYKLNFFSWFLLSIKLAHTLLRGRQSSNLNQVLYSGLKILQVIISNNSHLTFQAYIKLLSLLISIKTNFICLYVSLCPQNKCLQLSNIETNFVC